VNVGGIGGTQAGNALSLAAIRVTLENVLTEKNYARMIPFAARWAEGVAQALAKYAPSCHLTQLDGRAEYCFSPNPLRNGGEADAAGDNIITNSRGPQDA